MENHAQLATPSRTPALGSLLLIARDIKLAHSVFALPFAVLAAFMIAPRVESGGIDWAGMAGLLALVLVCMVAARTWAMVVNRLADRKIDAANPRTKGRVFASGDLSPRAGWLTLMACAGLFLAACALFGVFFGNWWPVALGVPVLAWIAFYSFTKRFTWLCHVFLGGALAASPLAAAIAVGGIGTMAEPALWLLAGMVLLWVAGFDAIYALQDLDFDREAGLRSIPARFGWKRANVLSRIMHVGAIVCLVGVWLITPAFAVVFGVGVIAAIGLLAYEHVVLARRGAAGIPMAFFTLNGMVSILLGLTGVVDVLV
ncbi:MAG: 4-hydroxybenzoate octaprenyltransferase [Phycisphaerales bacterium]|nr:4-hydroxybenzoate octaprenyltransferase [Phycisphaerales bacterium]